MAVMASELETAVAKQLDILVREFADLVPEAQLRALGREHFERIHRAATITDFIPLLVYRYARDDVLSGRDTTGPLRQLPALP